MRINPNSSIRSGYEFEDLFVMKLCFDWLKTPKLYKSIKIQNIPDEVETSKFYLDDIIATGSANNYYYYQLKHKQNPETDYWTLQSFLDKGLKEQSLLEKWISSFTSVPGKKHLGHFITNGKPDDDLRHSIKNEKLDLIKLENDFPDWYSKLTEYFKDKKQMQHFCKSFSFQFEHVSKEAFDRYLRDLYYTDLKITKAGYDNLMLYVITQGSQKFPEEFTLERLKSLLEWYTPRPLKQNFEVPQDFELHDNSKHQQLLSDLKKVEGGIKVVIGKPGVGKSTYLSNLHATLSKDLNILSVRHHYHLNPKDSSYYERLEAQRAEEAVKAEFLKLPKSILGEFANQNLKHTHLRDLITNIANYHYHLGKTFVLIIDGLDHVIRERKSVKELTNFLDQILFPQKGLWVILGTQELAVPYFGNTIHRLAPKQSWIEIKGLNIDSIRNIVLNGAIKKLLPKEEFTMRNVVTKIASITKGNALHLRYILNQLKTRNEPINESDLNAILPYKDEIADYYADLWRQVPGISKTFALALVLFDCKFSEQDIIELGGYITTSPSKISEGLSQIRHLLRVDTSGISVYHNSFLVFINNQEEVSQQKQSVYSQARKWLKKTTNEHLRWFLLPQVEYFLGNAKPLLSINKDWVIDNYLLCRSEIQITSLLELASEAAFKAKNFSKVLQYGIYANCMANREDNLHNALPKIWSLAFQIERSSKNHYPDIDCLEAYQIKEYIIDLSRKGVLTHIPDEVYDRMNQLLLEDRDHSADQLVSEWITLLVHFEKEKSAKQVHKFVSQFKDRGTSGNYFALYIELLLKDGKVERAKEMLSLKFNKQELDNVYDAIIDFDFENGSDYGIEFVPGSYENNIKTKLYNLIKRNKRCSPVALPNEEDLPQKIDFHGDTSRTILNLYTEQFFNGILICLNGEESKIHAWELTMDDRFSIMVMKQTFEVSKYFAKAFSSKTKIEYDFIIDTFELLRMLDYHDDYKIYELRRFIIPNCITTFLRFAFYYNNNLGFTATYSQENIIKLQACKWFYYNTFLKHILSFDKPPITPEGLEVLADQLIQNSHKDVEPFKDAAETYADLALIAYKCNKILLAKKLLSCSAQNIISYGYHKDMYLYNIIKAVEVCAVAGSKKTLKYIKDIAPYVHAVKDFTDGDETGTFIHDLADLYKKFNNQWMYGLFATSVIEKEYYDADSFFSDIVSVLPLPDKINEAILNTIHDQHSYNNLIYRSQNEKNARVVLKKVQEVLGEIDYRENNSTNSYKSKKTRKPDYSKVLPVNINNHLSKIKIKEYEKKEYVQRNYLREWFSYWKTKKGSQRLEAYFAVKAIAEKSMQDLSPEILKGMYNIALEKDRDFAFKCLVWYHANDNIWGGFWSKGLEESRTMWQTAIDYFPDKLDEYFEKTIFFSGAYYDRGESYFLPFPKAVAFYVDNNNLSSAEKILESAIACMKELTPGLNLPVPAYIEGNSVIDEFDILLIRLAWVNPVVRERAADGIAKILSSDIDGTYHKKVLAWLSKQHVESIVINGLLVLLKALELPKTKSFTHLLSQDLIGFISVRCTSIYILLDLLYQQLELVFPIWDFDTHFDLEIKEAEELNKFKRITEQHIQPIYQDICTSLEKKIRVNVLNLWALIFENKKTELGLLDSWQDDNYCNTRSQFMPARITIISDVLKSSFMKMLDYLYHNSYINSGDLFFHAFRMIPVDMSLWRIKLSKQPSWWPAFKNVTQNPNKIILSELTNPISELVKPKNGWSILHLSGSIANLDSFYENTLQGHIELIPFAYKILGTNIPSEKTIYLAIDNFGQYYPAGNFLNSFNCLDNGITFSTDNTFPVTEGDVLLFPLVANTKSLAINIWQYYRMFDGLPLPIPKVSEGLTIKTKKGKLCLTDNNDNAIYKFDDFLFGLRDRTYYHCNIPYGGYLSVKTDFIESILEKQGVRLAYACKVTYKTREYVHSEDIKESTVYDLINFSSIICRS